MGLVHSTGWGRKQFSTLFSTTSGFRRPPNLSSASNLLKWAFSFVRLLVSIAGTPDPRRHEVLVYDDNLRVLLNFQTSGGDEGEGGDEEPAGRLLSPRQHHQQHPSPG